jgi:ribosomal-protein-alanine N-acetyltransferase
MTTPTTISAAAPPREAAPRPVPDVTGRIAHPAFRPVVHTARLVLRPLGESDVPAIVAMLGDLAVSKMLARIPHPFTPEDGQAYLAFARWRSVAQRGIEFGVAHRDRLIGAVGLNNLGGRSRIAYWLGRGHWGRGYATEAVGAVVAYAFETLGVRMLRAGVFVDNPASLHVLVKLGFRPTRRPEAQSLARNEPRQHIATVLTRVRFQGLNP